jgi:deoxycytidylate deaminase
LLQSILKTDSVALKQIKLLDNLLIAAHTASMISKTKQKIHERMLRVAATISDLSDVPRYKFGSVLVFNKTVVSSGHNSRKTHPLQHKLNKNREEGKQMRSFVHAEINCLSKMREIPQNSILYISRVNADGKFMMARPCGACMNKIKKSGIKTIAYSTEDGFAIEWVKDII